MAEATPTEVYQSFCDEAALLQASIAGIESTPSLTTLDQLSAARARLGVVQEALPGLCSAHERFEAAERYAGIVAVQAPRWSDAATAKSNALSTIAALLGQVRDAQTAYEDAHAAQMAVLRSLPYSAQYRATYAPASQSLTTIVQVVAGGDASWLSRVQTFDALGVCASLPTE